MSPRPHNIFADIPAELPAELFETLAAEGGAVIERIVSRGHTSPENFWYDQEKSEFVILVRGRARIVFEESRETAELTAGDYLHIPARCRHRVEWTDPEQDTVWLAVHC